MFVSSCPDPRTPLQAAYILHSSWNASCNVIQHYLWLCGNVSKNLSGRHRQFPRSKGLSKEEQERQREEGQKGEEGQDKRRSRRRKKKKKENVKKLHRPRKMRTAMKQKQNVRELPQPPHSQQLPLPQRLAKGMGTAPKLTKLLTNPPQKL